MGPQFLPYLFFQIWFSLFFSQSAGKISEDPMSMSMRKAA